MIKLTSGASLPGMTRSIMLALALIAALALGLAVACQPGPDDAAPAPGSDGAPAGVAPASSSGDSGVPGVFDDHIRFGQSAALTGPARQLGQDMQLGIRAAFQEINAAGGVHGRQLRLISLDDTYEPELALANTRRLVQGERVFALIGGVGTPTAQVAVTVAEESGTPFLAPFTGAELLRDPALDTVLNLRASYYQETEEMVARLTEDRQLTRIAVFYQDDSFGQAGLEGARRALARRNLEPVAAWSYERNTTGVKDALVHLIEIEPQAVIMIGAYAPVAELTLLARRKVDPVFMAVSFVGSHALASELGADGAGIYVTQVAPNPDDAGIPVVAAYQAALAGFRPSAPPGFVSLEGYLAGRLAAAGLERCGPAVSQQCFLDAIRGAGALDIDGFRLDYGDGDNQGSDAVFLTVLGDDGELYQVDTLNDAR